MTSSFPSSQILVSLSRSFLSFLPSQCSSVCHGGCLNKQTHKGPWRARRRDEGLFALVAPVRAKVFLRGTQRSGAERRDHKTNIYPPASSAWALSSLDDKQEDGPTFGSEEKKRCGSVINKDLTLDLWAVIGRSD